jgi:hypothetical protein
VDQLIYIFECRLKLRDENSSLDFKTLISTSQTSWSLRVQGDFKKLFTLRSFSEGGLLKMAMQKYPKRVFLRFKNWGGLTFQMSDKVNPQQFFCERENGAGR